MSLEINPVGSFPISESPVPANSILEQVHQACLNDQALIDFENDDFSQAKLFDLKNIALFENALKVALDIYNKNKEQSGDNQAWNRAREIICFLLKNPLLARDSSGMITNHLIACIKACQNIEKFYFGSVEDFINTACLSSEKFENFIKNPSLQERLRTQPLLLEKALEEALKKYEDPKNAEEKEIAVKILSSLYEKVKNNISFLNVVEKDFVSRAKIIIENFHAKKTTSISFKLFQSIGLKKLFHRKTVYQKIPNSETKLQSSKWDFLSKVFSRNFWIKPRESRSEDIVAQKSLPVLGIQTPKIDVNKVDQKPEDIVVQNPLDAIENCFFGEGSSPPVCRDLESLEQIILHTNKLLIKGDKSFNVPKFTQFIDAFVDSYADKFSDKSSGLIAIQMSFQKLVTPEIMDEPGRKDVSMPREQLDNSIKEVLEKYTQENPQLYSEGFD